MPSNRNLKRAQIQILRFLRDSRSNRSSHLARRKFVGLSEASPIAYTQTGVAARIAHHGVGEFIELDELTTERLRPLIEKVLRDLSYRERTDHFQKVISKTRGLDVAADIIEQAFGKY